MDQNQPEEWDQRWERAVRLLKEAVAEANVRDCSEYKGTPAYFIRYWNVDPQVTQETSELPAREWDVFKIDYPRDVILLIQLNRPEGVTWIETSLLGAALDLIQGAERIINAPESDRVFNIENQEDREEAIDFNVRATLVSYINYLPTMLAKAVEGAFVDSIERQVKTSIEPLLRDHWRSIGLPDNFSILSAWDRHSFIKQLEKFRKQFVGKMKIKPPIPDTLPNLYLELRLAYKTARKHHNESRTVFLASNRQDETAWKNYWDENCMKMFPTLAYHCLMMLCEEGHQKNGIEPRELAYKHLSFLFARSPEYMRKQVSIFTRLAKDKARSDALKS